MYLFLFDLAFVGGISKEGVTVNSLSDGHPVVDISVEKKSDRIKLFA